MVAADAVGYRRRQLESRDEHANTYKKLLHTIHKA